MDSPGKALRSAALAVLVAAGVASLAGCGFAPVYGGSGETSTALSRVFVSVIPNRNGQELREALQLRLDNGAAGGSKTLVLDVTYSIAATGLSIQADNASTRSRLTADANWRLHSAADGKVTLAQGTARALDGFNVLNSQFFYADLSDQAAEKRLAEQIAEQITARLAAFLRAHPELV